MPDGERIAAHLSQRLFVSQRDHGIDTHGAARGDVGSRERDERQQNRDADKCERVGGPDVKKQR